MLKRNVKFVDGTSLELEYDESFYDKVRVALDLGTFDIPTDKQLCFFLRDVCKIAFDKAEEEMKRDGTWEE